LAKFKRLNASSEKCPNLPIGCYSSLPNLLNPIVRVSNTDGAAYLYCRYRNGIIVGDRWLGIVVKYLEAYLSYCSAFGETPIEAHLYSPPDRCT
jgi:hypothetical protein